MRFDQQPRHAPVEDGTFVIRILGKQQKNFRGIGKSFCDYHSDIAEYLVALSLVPESE